MTIYNKIPIDCEITFNDSLNQYARYNIRDITMNAKQYYSYSHNDKFFSIDGPMSKEFELHIAKYVIRQQPYGNIGGQ
jgi:hypothetical protein